MKKAAVIVLSLVVAFSAAGCMGKSIVVPKAQPAPASERPEEVVIDWNQVVSDCEDLLDKEEYPYGKAIDYMIDDEAGMIGLAWMVDDACTYDEAPAYATGFIKAFNDAIAIQNFDFAVSGENYYGGVFDLYGCEIYVFHEADQENPEKYLVAQVVAAGSNATIVANK